VCVYVKYNKHTRSCHELFKNENRSKPDEAWLMDHWWFFFTIYAKMFYKKNKTE